MDVGAQLRASREAKGVSLESIARSTRIQPRILAAIEQNDIAAIPPRPSGRSFVCSYAREVGLDPSDTVHDYFAQFAPVVGPEETTASPAPTAERTPAVVWAGGAVLALALVLLVATATQRILTRAPGPAETAAVGTSGQGVAAAAGSAPAVSSHAEDRAPAAPSAPTQDLTVVLTASAPCWVTATADGKRVIHSLLPSGTRETLRATREITIRAGDAGALSIDVNGAGSRVLGSQGQVRTLRLMPDTPIAR